MTPSQQLPTLPAQPLYDLLGQIRQPVTLRELMAVCLRHIYTGNPVSENGESLLPAPRTEYVSHVVCKEETINGHRCVRYRPKDKVESAIPLMLYLHGGGFVIGCSEDTDYATRRLCLDNNLEVVSINYPLAPEATFPTAIEACLDVLDYIRDHAGSVPIDKKNLLLAGDSAGGNLAAALALELPTRGVDPTALVMLAPWLDMHVESYDSYNALAPTGVIYDAAFIGYARGAYVRSDDWKNPLASPIFCDPERLPPTMVIAGTDDPLIDQSVALKTRASLGGLEHIELVTYEGMPHCFYLFPQVFAEEEDCYLQIARFIKAQLHKV